MIKEIKFLVCIQLYFKSKIVSKNIGESIKIVQNSRLIFDNMFVRYYN